MTEPFHRVALVNRGEPAMRFIHAIREFNLERGTDLQVVAVFTEVDRQSRFVREADDGVSLGESTWVDERDGLRRPSYLNYGELARAIAESRADAVWAGWGFVAERPEFAAWCEQAGLAFIGPSSGAMRRLGDKINAKRLAVQTGIPVVEWNGGPVSSLDAARVDAARLGYPVLVKASGGAGGRGIRRVDDERGLERAIAGARRDAARIFLDDTVFLEAWLPGVRHVEVQVQADRHGNVWAIGTRDCSLQRRFQKLMSEAPAPNLGPKIELALVDSAVRLVAAAKYESQASVEFLVGRDGRYAFLEANPRLQVEHVVTEQTTGIDLVKLQLHVALGGRIEPADVPVQGHAVEVRLNAEDPANDFAPSPGVLSLFRVPTGPGLRVDTGVAEGDVMPAEFGSMVAKFAARGHSRDEALGRLQRALGDSAVVVSGGPTNRSFLLDLLDDAEVRRGTVDVQWLDRRRAADGGRPERHARLALLQAAVEVYDAELEVEIETFFASASRMRPSVRPDVGRAVELSYRGHRYALKVHRVAPGRYRVVAGGSQVPVEVERAGPCERRLTYDGRRHRVIASVQGYSLLVEIDGVPHTIARADEGVVRAPSPAVVVAVGVKPGDVVSAGERLLVLEAMKMETAVVAPFAGSVRQVFVLPNAQVGPGSPLLHLEPGSERTRRKDGPPVLLGETGPARPASRARALLRGVRAGIREFKRPTPPAEAAEVLSAMRAVMLGFDADADSIRGLLDAYAERCRAIGPDDAGVRAGEDDVLQVFADIHALFSSEHEGGATTGVSLGSEQYLRTYLRTLDADGAELPPAFVSALRTAVAHYGTTLAPSAPLKEALLFLFKAQKRTDLQVPVIRAILQRRLADAEVRAPGPPAFLALLQRVAAVLQARFSEVSDLARDVHYRYAEQPAFERVRDGVQREMVQLVSSVVNHGDADGSALRTLVECPQPLRTAFAARFETFSCAERRVALEALLRRDYRIRTLDGVTPVQDRDLAIVRARYGHLGDRIEVVSLACPLARVREALARVRTIAAGVEADRDVALELYSWTEAEPDADALSAELRARLAEGGFDRPLRRAVVMIASRETSRERHLGFFTFRPSGPEYREEPLYRRMHPMLAKRLQLWRLDRFFLERLPSVEDVYLFRAVARENAKDERFIALAEVRDATPVRDASRRIVSVPHLERMAMEALTAVRRAQMRRLPGERLHWNRVVLLLWQRLALSRPELDEIAHRLAVGAEGLGLEKLVIRGHMPGQDGEHRDTVLSVSLAGGRAPVSRFSDPSDASIRTLSDYDQKVVRMRQRGLTYPYEIVRLLVQASGGDEHDVNARRFTELDLSPAGELVPVDRPYGRNEANIVVGLIENRTPKHPQGMRRVILLGDPSREVGSLAEPECRRIMAALALAARDRLPLEWFALSAGAKISMESGTENMDWIALVLRRLVEFTQAGGEVNIIVTGINVGAQPYWNAEATMLMHTRGILVMVPEGAMVLTGKTALDYSGSVSAEDNLGIGGYEHIMGPNGQAQYRARDLRDACDILLRHYDHCYVVPGERFPRRATTVDPTHRDIRDYPHGGGTGSFERVGDVFSDEANPGRKRPFDIRRVMAAVCDQDHAPLERWPGWRDAEVAVTWDAHIGGYPVCLLGLESRPIPRLGPVPADGPEQWTSGTLFPMSSKKIARAINAASENRPLVILANLSGFDGSPESMRRRQLEFGAEIGRAVVNFRGPIVFVVVSRYHGGAFVVFSKTLNENMEVVAIEGSYASVIGGAPAAAVVFAREVDARTKSDPRIVAMRERIAAASESGRASLLADLGGLQRSVRSEKLGEVAEEFDTIHTVRRALDVGSLDRIISAADLRPYLVDAIERGMAKERGRDTDRTVDSR